MTRRPALATAAALLLVAACGGDDGGGTQPQTEQGAIDAAVDATRGSLEGDVDAVLNFTTEECRETLDRDEVQFALLFVRGFIEESDIDLDAVGINGTIEAFDGDTATVQITYDLPEGAEDADGFLLTDDEIDLVYENDRWVAEECQGGGDTEAAEEAATEARTAELEALGVAGTREDPAPGGAAITVGNGYRIVLGDYTVDVGDLYEEQTGFSVFVDEGEVVARLQFTANYTAPDDEPGGADALAFSVFGADGVELSASTCGFPGEPSFADRVFSGALIESSVCVNGTPEQLATPVVTVGVGFAEGDLFFDPLTTAATPETLTGTNGPDPDGRYTGDRAAPEASGTPVDLDNGWTMTVDSVQLDGTEAVLAESDFASAPSDGEAFSLVDLTLTYDGDEPQSPSTVQLLLVGDDNRAVGDGCSSVSLENQIDPFADLLAGTTVSGTFCFETNVDQHESLVLMATTDFFDEDWVFVAVR